MSKEEYEMTILHGAQKIMQAKNNRIEQVEINIDALIQEGIENHKNLLKKADEQANLIE